MKLPVLLGVCAVCVLTYGVWALKLPILWYPASWLVVGAALLALARLWTPGSGAGAARSKQQSQPSRSEPSQPSAEADSESPAAATSS